MSTGGDHDVTFKFNIETDPKATEAAKEIGKAADDQIEKFLKAEQAWQQLQKAKLDAVEEAAKQQKVNEAYDAFREKVHAAAGALVGLAKDTALFGLASERDMAKSIQGIEKLQTAYEGLKQAMEVVKAFKEVWAGFRAIQDAALEQGAAGAAKAAGSLLTSGVGSAAGGALAGAAGSAAGGAAAGAGEAVAGAAGGAAAGGLAAVALPAAAIAGIAVIAFDAIRGKYGKADEGILGSAGGAIGRAAWNYTPSWLSAQGVGTESDRSTEAIEKAQVDRANRLTAEQQFYQNRTQGFAIGNREADAREAGLRAIEDAASFGMTGEESIGQRTTSLRARQGRNLARFDAANAAPATDLAGKQQQNREQLAALQEAIALRKEEAQLAKEASHERMKAAEKEIHAAEHAVNLAKAEEDRLHKQKQTSEQRFGSMSKADQQATLRAVRKSQSGGKLNEHDLKLIGGLGLEGSDEIVRDESSRRAKAGGFDEITSALGQDKRIAAAEAATAKRIEAEVTLKSAQEIKIKLESDLQKQLEQIREQLKPILEAQNKSIIEALQLQGQANAHAAETAAARKVAAENATAQ